MSRKLAIKGHGSRGKEIVEILKMLGAQNTNIINGCCTYLAYYIDDDGNIETISSYNDDEFVVFSLQEFLSLYPYKINDLLDLKNDYLSCIITGMRWNEKSECVEYHAEFGPNNDYGWYNANSFRTPNEIIETPMKKVLAELLIHIKNTPKEELEKEFNELEEWSHFGPTVEEFMEFCDKVHKKPVYPTTYEECCKITEDVADASLTCFACKLLNDFQKLLLCRDAYWEIAGEQMGLGKPWGPNWTTFEGMPGIFRFRYNIVCDSIKDYHCLLVFPTEEMRDAFYENFKDLIESCKELL